MRRNEFTVFRKLINALIIAVVILAALLLSRGEFAFLGLGRSQDTADGASSLAAGSAEKFALLSGQGGERSIGST